MTRPERMIVLVACLAVLAKIAALGEATLEASLYGPVGPSYYQEQYWMLIRFFISALVNLGAAVWIFLEARAAGLRAWIWALLGLFFGLLGVAVYYVAQTYASRATQPAKRVDA